MAHMSHEHSACATYGPLHVPLEVLLPQHHQTAAATGPVHRERIELHSSGNRVIVESPAMRRHGLTIQKGPIGFDDDLFAAGKRAENAGSARGCPPQNNKC